MKIHRNNSFKLARVVCRLHIEYTNIQGDNRNLVLWWQKRKKNSVNEISNSLQKINLISIGGGGLERGARWKEVEVAKVEKGKLGSFTDRWDQVRDKCMDVTLERKIRNDRWQQGRLCDLNLPTESRTYA